MRPRAAVAAAVSFLALGLPAPASTVPIHSNEGFTAFDGQFVVRTQVRVHVRGDDPDPSHRRMTVIEAPATLVYGFDERWTGIAVVPYVSKDLDLTTPSGRRRRGDAGIGDVTLMGKYRLWTRDEPGARTTRLSILGGTTLPTGADDAADGLGRLPRGLQVGRGTFDPVAGLTATHWTPFWVLSGDLVYRAGGEDEGYEFGDSLRYDLAYERAIWPRELPEEGLPDYLYAIVEMNGEVAGRDKSFGAAQGSTGGHILYVSPGLQFITPRSAIEGGVQIPLVTDPNGVQPEPEATFVLSTRFSW